METWMCAGSGNQSPDHAHSPHSVFAKRSLITRHGTMFCCWRPLVSDHQTRDLKQLLHTIYVDSFLSIWHVIGKGCNSYFSLVGGVPMKTPDLLIYMMNIHDSSNLNQADLLPFLSLPYYSSCAECYM